MSTNITAIVLVKNEERHIAECINSIKDAVDRIVVVDSFSSDNTVSIAKELGADVYEHEFINYAKQYQYAIDNTGIDTKWILRFDADERLTEDSALELVKLCKENINTNVNGITLRFKRIFLGKHLLHGGVYPWLKLVCYKKEFGHIEDKEMDEHIVVEGKIIKMKNDSLHLDSDNLVDFINKHNSYSSREARDYLNFYKTKRNTYGIKDWIKCNIYYKLPLGFRAYLYYIYRYYLCFGFLDGKEGHMYAFLQAYWYRYLVDAKIYERQKKK